MRRETLRWKRGSYGQPFNFLDFTEGAGQVITGDVPEIADQRRDASLASTYQTASVKLANGMTKSGSPQVIEAYLGSRWVKRQEQLAVIEAERIEAQRIQPPEAGA